MVGRRVERGRKSRRDTGDLFEQRWIGASPAEVGDGPERRLRFVGARSRICGSVRGSFRAGHELVGLVGQRSAAAVHLEQHGLGGLAREPQLASPGVVPEPFGRHRRLTYLEQRVEPDDRQLSDQVTRVPSHEDGETPEPLLLRTPQQLEAGRRVRSKKCRCAPAECRGNRALRPRLDVEDAQSKRLAACR